ncbi:MAG: bifunctional diaminohydroxyphosphoribosylaminopyrimidine deaminase/5-amino-6-(5-phosphoribosylamino)uracil reductase RibD [Verrucomicrobiales bacterium]|nr:bifunctional diaminohydroxyphosphoribosylaminopyrimidine deaminase/5-amino-6-(5-phosphoribosylamino)uracil reductase RibD [Verrucomicrobiales bacterium]
MTHSDEHFMKLALKQAKKGLGLTSPNPPVGAVIVSSEGVILAKGYHHRAGANHAEIDAIENCLKKNSVKKLINATIFVTLEPCSTCGKTPACTDSLVQYQFSRVVYGCCDPNPKHRGRAKSLLLNKGIDVTTGVLEYDCALLIRFFTKTITKELPWLIAKSAMTLDGCTTLPNGMGPWITGTEALNDVQVLRSQVDAILIGGNTLRADNPRLTLRGRYAQSDRLQPWRIISTRSGDLPNNSHVFTDQYSDRTLIFHNKSLRQILKSLTKRNIHSVLMESGGKLLANALKNDLVDELILYYAPIIGGGPTQAVQSHSLSRRLKHIQSKRFGDDIRLSGLIHEP